MLLCSIHNDGKRRQRACEPGKVAPASCLSSNCVNDEPTCPLCGRPLGEANIDRHHLMPRAYKGKGQFPIHKICHRKIHSLFTERELRDRYHAWEALRRHDDICNFIAWVSRKPPGHYARTETSNRKRR
jgi:hypothetical protein